MTWFLFETKGPDFVRLCLMLPDTQKYRRVVRGVLVGCTARSPVLRVDDTTPHEQLKDLVS